MEWSSIGPAGAVIAAGAAGQNPVSRPVSFGSPIGSEGREGSLPSRPSAPSARAAAPAAPANDRKKHLDGTDPNDITGHSTGLANVIAAPPPPRLQCEISRCLQDGCPPQRNKFSGQSIVDANGNDVAAVSPKGCHCCPPGDRSHDAVAATPATITEGGEHRRTSGASTSSFQALQHAVLTLYRQDDFTLEKIGEGFFSDVFKVVHRTSGEVMALKMNRNGCNRASMLREVELMNRLSHPNILRFRGVCVHGGQLHAVVEYVNGGSLHQTLVCDQDSARLPWQERIRLSVDIAKGMNYLHSQGYIHRDLTSRNVLVSDKEGKKTAIVSDFGLAAKIPGPDDADKHLAVVGSPYWMAPECLRGDDYDQTADVFSYGIILCETIAIIDADPDSLPRTENFGLDYIAFCNLIEDCPLYFLYLAFRCAQMDPGRRPTFREAEDCLQGVLVALQQQEQQLLQEQEEEEQLVQQDSATTVDPFSATPNGAPRAKPSPATQKAAQATQPRSSRRFSIKDFHGHKRSKSAGQLDLSELLADESKDLLLLSPSSSTSSTSPHVVARRMTKEDPFYTPAPANTNPFASSQRYKDGHKLLASCEADEAEDDDGNISISGGERTRCDGGKAAAIIDDDALSLRFLLPSAPASAAATLLRRQSLRHTSSLPELSDGATEESLAVEVNGSVSTDAVADSGSSPSKLSSDGVGLPTAVSCSIQLTCCPPDEEPSGKPDPGASLSCDIDCQPADTGAAVAAATAAAIAGQRRSSTGQLQLPSSHYKQLSLECAMLFCGLDLIRSQRSRTSETSDASSPSDAASGTGVFAAISPAAVSPVDDLECEFEDNLNDVLRSCGSAPPMSPSWQQSILASGRAAAPESVFGKSSPSDDDGITAADTECGGAAGGCKNVPASTRIPSDEDGRPQISSRYVNPTLAEKRRQLKQVQNRGRSSSSGCTTGTVDKLEQLQLKLDHLRQLNDAEKKQRRRMSSVM